MNWIIENWSLIVVIVVAIMVAFFYAKKFLNKPTEEQLKSIREWLLYACTMAEMEFGGGTGKIKLRKVYDAFLTKFPWAAKAISFDEFSCMVDAILVDMRKLLETNEAIKGYING